MNNKYPYSQLYLLLFSCILIISSIGQDKTNLLQDSTIVSESILNFTLVEENQTVNQDAEIPWIDPLFFIDGQLCQHVRKIFQDKSGNLWFGTNVYGLIRYNGDTLEYFTEKDELGGGRITGIVEDDKGNVWIGTYAGLTKFDGRSFTTYTEKDGLLNKEIWSLIIDTKGIFWIGHNAGISRFDGKEFTTFPIPKAHVKDTTTVYSYDRITSIIEDRKGNFWFGTDGFGICKYNPKVEPEGTDKTFTLLTKEDGLPDNTIYDLMEDSHGNLWIGTFFGGVCKYDGVKFTNFTNTGLINGVEVSGFFEDSSGDIWFAAENFGVYYYDGTSFTNYNADNGLITNGILCIYEDREKRFWFGGWGGLFRYDPSALLRPDGETFFTVTKNGPWAE